MTQRIIILPKLHQNDPAIFCSSKATPEITKVTQAIWLYDISKVIQSNPEIQISSIKVEIPQVALGPNKVQRSFS